MDFEELRKMHRAEKNSTMLSQAKENFLEELAEYVSRKKKQYLERVQSGSTATEDYSNIERMAREILEIRTRKILRKAMQADSSESLEGLSNEEKKLFKTLKETLSQHFKKIDNALNNAPKKPAGEKSLNTMQVQIVKEVPSFVGADLKEYGPFEKGQSIELNQEIGEILVARKLAVKQE